jgi:hypothetical protein
MLLRLKTWASVCALLLFLTGASHAYQSKKQPGNLSSLAIEKFRVTSPGIELPNTTIELVLDRVVKESPVGKIWILKRKPDEPILSLVIRTNSEPQDQDERFPSGSFADAFDPFWSF